SGAPTGWAPFDAVLRAVFAALVTVAAARAGALTALWLTAIASLATVVADCPVDYLATAALGLVVAQIGSGQKSPIMRALAAALAVQALLRLGGPLLTGASAFAVLVAVVPALVVGSFTLSKREQRIVRRVIAGSVAFCALGVGVSVLAVLSARHDIDSGLQSGVSGQAAIGGGDPNAAPTALRSASSAFRHAEHTLDSWWAKPALAIPFVAQQTRAVKTMASAGAALTDQAVDALANVDPASLSPKDGRIDLAAVAKVEAPLTGVADTLERSQRMLDGVASPWLLPPVADRYRQLTHKINRALETAAVAKEASRLAPAMLGANGPRRYLLVVQTPSEARGSGGFMGNWGEITAIDGRIELARFGRITELNDARGDLAAITIKNRDNFIAQYGDDAAKTWGVNNFSPDFSAVADVLAQLYPQSGGEPVDGVIEIDPYGLARMLQAVGEVRVEGWPDAITKDNAAEVLLHEQYVRFSGTGALSNEARKDFVGETAQVVFHTLVNGGFSGFSALADAMAPAIDGRHLQLVSMHPDEEKLFTALDATGAPPPVRADSVGVVGQNFNGNKIDWYLTRRASYDVHWDPSTGAVNGTLKIELTNDAPTSGAPNSVIQGSGVASEHQTETADGENLMLLSIYSAFPLQSLTIDGQPLDVAHYEEAGRQVYTGYVSVLSKTTRTVVATMQGTISPGQPYSLDPVWQPVVTPDHLDVNVEVPSGWVLSQLDDLQRQGDHVATGTWLLDQNHAGRATARRTQNALIGWIRGER
ncbi:MAG: hypothetical protein QOG30_1444, partial [Acidimicrobiaceae bacterium]